MSSNVLTQIESTAPESEVLTERPTLWTAAANVLQSHEEGPPLRRVSAELPAPLSFAQERLWFLDRASPGSAAYHIPFAWRLRGPLSIPALQTALNRIVQRHTIFQTRYQQANGTPVQIGDVVAPVVVTTELQWMDECAEQPFDLAAPPLIRANVLICGDEEFFLTLVVHHIVFDGWSRGIFLRELNAEYAAALRGAGAPIPEPRVQYIDYAVWHRQWMEAGMLRREMPYWRRQLAPPLATLEMPTDHPRSSARGGAGAALFFSIPSDLYEGIERLRKEEMTTRFVVLLTAFKALLHRYTGQDDIVVGSVAANRNRPELRNVIGCFVNTLVLRTRVSPELTFRELLLRVEETVRGAFAHQEMPFERLVGELKPERAPHRSPLFQVMFALQNTGRAELDLAGTHSRSIPVHNGCAKFDLSVELSEQPGRLRACIEYNTALFDRATVHRMARHFAILLGGAIENPDTQLRDLPLLGRAEEQQLVVGCNNTATHYPRHLSVPALFRAVARRRPEAIALEDGAVRWTYARLDRRSEVIARALQQLGVDRGTLVALAAARCPDTIAAMLGILKAGGAYVPIDPSAPAERIRFLFDDSAATVVVAQKDLLQRLPRSSARVLCLDDLPELPVAACASVDGGPEDLAYVLYTSGSTGKPKGVCVPHRGIIRLVRNTNYITLGDNDVVAQAASLSFDAATFEVWGALLNGSRLVFLPHDTVLAPVQLAGALRSRNITTLFLTTSLFNLVAAQAPTAFQPLRTMLFGGEVVDPDAVRAILEHGAPKRLLNVYGPTETTTFATWHEIYSLGPNETAVPIGKPIANTEVHLLDPAGNLVPVGVRGEIYIGGDGVALGYHRRRELTAEKFVERQFGTFLPRRQKLYRTGDFAVRRADGAVEFIGRADDQVKIRGFRVEPSEIEIALRHHPEVGDCCVVVRQSPSAGKQLACYVVAASERGVAARDLRLWLGVRLPEYMIPATFAFLPRLPLNSNGKVDRAALPQPEAELENSAVKPWMPLHVQLVEIWEQLLDVKPIGISDNFFDLGGHSLLAVRLMDRIEKECGRRLPVSTLFECATIEKLANAILQREPGPDAIVEIQAGDAGAPFFFLHGDLWGGGLYCRQLAYQLGPERPFYALPPHSVSPGQPLPTIEAMAAGHLHTLRQYRPHGPYILGGFCVSALVALEMAQQLTRAGEQVELLVLLDPPRPGALRWLRRWSSIASTIRGRDEKAQVAQFFHGFGRVFRVRELWKQNAVQKLGWLKNRVHRKPAAPPQESATSDAAGAYLWAAAGFRPPRYAHRAAIICCDAVMGSATSRFRRWRRFLPHLADHVVDCAHLELVTTRSAEIANILRAILDTAERPVGSPAESCRVQVVAGLIADASG
jgi:amino acid adenylation domain-containing protein